MSVRDVLIQYENRLSDLQLSIVQLRLPHALTAAILVIAIGLVLVLILYAIRMQASYLLPAFPGSDRGGFAWRLQQHRQTKYRIWRFTRFYERSVQRLKGNWAGSGITGEEFGQHGHVYAADLHVFGEGSLFELLCIARTSIGQRGLAKYLIEASSIEQTPVRQDAVRELRGGWISVNELPRLASSSFSNRNGAPSKNGWRPHGPPSLDPSRDWL